MTEYKTVKLLATDFTEKYLNDLRSSNKSREGHKKFSQNMNSPNP